MVIPNVVVGELIDPVTFGNAVVDAVNEHETEIENRLPLTGGTLAGDLQVDGTIRGAIANHPTKVGFRSGFVNQNTNASGEISITYSPALTYANGVALITPFTTSGTTINHVQVKASSQWGFTVTCWADGSRVNNDIAQFFWLAVEYE